MADEQKSERLPMVCRIGVHRFRHRHVMGQLYDWSCTYCHRKWNR